MSSSQVELLGLISVEITNTKQALKLIETGNLKRAKAHTKLNIVWFLFFFFFR